MSMSDHNLVVVSADVNGVPAEVKDPPKSFRSRLADWIALLIVGSIGLGLACVVGILAWELIHDYWLPLLQMLGLVVGTGVVGWAFFRVEDIRDARRAKRRAKILKL